MPFLFIGYASINILNKELQLLKDNRKKMVLFWIHVQLLYIEQNSLLFKLLN